MKNVIYHKTCNNQFKIQYQTTIIKVSDVHCDYSKTEKLCLEGCRNYNKKYSCPPKSPDFKVLSKKYSHFVVNIFRIDLAEYKQQYNTIRMTNVVNKSVQRKVFNKAFLNNNFTEKIVILENGSCRLCKKCNLQNGMPCKYPDKMRPSLEACGINVDALVIKCFEFDLKWYKKNKQACFPEYQCTVGGILTNNPDLIIQTLNEAILQHKKE
jgi:predicted metal-binding protein